MSVFFFFWLLCTVYKTLNYFIFFGKNNFKIESHSIIYIFKNYFVIVFSVLNNKQYLNKS